MVVLKNYEVELSYTLADLLNKCLKESCFPQIVMLEVSSVVSAMYSVFKSVGERSLQLENAALFSLLSG